MNDNLLRLIPTRYRGQRSEKMNTKWKTLSGSPPTKGLFTTIALAGFTSIQTTARNGQPQTGGSATMSTRKVAEHWDVIQPVPVKDLANGSTMFGF
jgi:hypothetical protein